MPLLSGSGKAPAGFGDLFRNMAQGCALHEILTDGQGQAVDYVYLEVNPAFERLTGLSRDGILGRRVTEVLAGIEPSWIETYGRVALTGEPASFERYFPAPLDRWYQVFAYQPAPRQFVSILVDITDRHRIEEELRAGEAKFRQIFNGANVGKSLTLPTGEIEFNAAFCEMLGYTAAELAAKRWQDLTPAEEIEPVEKLLEPLLRGEKDSARFTKRYIRKNGSLIWGDVSTRMVRDAAGRPRHFITTVIDITPRKSAEEQLERTNRRIKDILASIQDDFYVLDRDWRFVFVSRQFTSKVGREPKDFVGNSIWEVFPKHLGTAYEENLRAAMDRREVRRFEIRGQYTDAVYRMTVFPSADGITVLGTDITEQKRTEEAARESDERLRFALETSRIGAWDLDLVDHTAYRSLDHDRIFGYEELLPEWTYEMFLGHVIPEDREEVDARFRRAAATKGMWNFECRIRRAGGEIRWIWAAGRHRLGPSGEASRMVGIVQDITERKEAEALRQALAEQENLRLGAAVEQAPDAIVMLGLDGAIRYANAAFGFINRMAKDAAKGRSYFDAFAPESSAASIRAAMAEGRVWQGHMTRTIGEGQPVELEVAIAAIRDPAGSVIGGLVTEKDVTYETALQRQLRQSQKMEALGTLAGGIAHDFNNILNPIFISMELALLEPSLDLGIRRHLEVGLKAAERGRDLVKQVIAFSRQKEQERRPVEAAPAVGEVVKFLRVSLPSTVEIKADIEDDVGLILGDPAQIQQIVMNLCANAAYAMRLAGGVLVVSLGRVEVDAELAARVPGLKIGSYVRLVVADTGSGMTPAVRERIFDPFFTTKGPGEGSGMGLPVVDGIVRNYDGAIAVESEEGRGSAFTVYLPRAEGRLGEDEGAPETLPRGSGRILLVDDEAVQIYSVRSLLEKLGYGVVAMTDGREALERFRADPEAFDLVVTDQTMPHLTGLQLASGMLGIRPDIPIILCTGYSEAVDAKTAHAAGIREFLMKPYSVREMAEVIRRTL